MDDLNIRAAKALGCDINIPTITGRCAEVKCSSLLLPVISKYGVGKWMNLENLKFTTSYDWAMLGVKEACRRIGDGEAKNTVLMAEILFEAWYLATPRTNNPSLGGSIGRRKK